MADTGPAMPQHEPPGPAASNEPLVSPPPTEPGGHDEVWEPGLPPLRAIAPSVMITPGIEASPRGGQVDLERAHAGLLGRAGRYGLENLAGLDELPASNFYLFVAPIKIAR